MAVPFVPDDEWLLSRVIFIGLFLLVGIAAFWWFSTLGMRVGTLDKPASRLKEIHPLKPDLILSLPAQPVPYAVLGSPVGHSLSPVMQQAAFDHAGLEARYYRIEVDDTGLERAVTRMRQVPFGGWNCTVPNKVRMYELCDRRAESAEQFRAVNTVVNEDGTLVGHNTDGIGWSRALREAFSRGADELRILLLGAGGAGRAVATQAILGKCPELIVANRERSTRAGAARPVERAVLRRSAGPHARKSPRRPLERARPRSRFAPSRPRGQRHFGGTRSEGAAILPARMIPPGCSSSTRFTERAAKIPERGRGGGRDVERRPGDAAPPGRGGLCALDGPEAPLEIMRARCRAAIPPRYSGVRASSLSVV